MMQEMVIDSEGLIASAFALSSDFSNASFSALSAELCDQTHEDTWYSFIFGFLRKGGIVDAPIFDPVVHHGHFNPFHMFIYRSWYDPL